MLRRRALIVKIMVYVMLISLVMSTVLYAVEMML